MKDFVDSALKRPFSTMLIVGSITLGIAKILRAVSLITKNANSAK